MVRCKVTCTEKVHSREDGGYVVRFSPVTSGSKENDEYFNYTPFGLIELGILNLKASEEFKIGKEYYVDFQKEK